MKIFCKSIYVSFIDSATLGKLPKLGWRCGGDLAQVLEFTAWSQIAFVHSTWKGGRQRCMVLILFFVRGCAYSNPHRFH